MEGLPVTLSEMVPTHPAEIRPGDSAGAPGEPTYELLRLALDGADLRAIIQALASRINRPTLVESCFGQILASATPSAQPAPELTALPTALRRAIPTGQLVRVATGRSEGKCELLRLVVPVVAHREVVGYLSVLEGDEPLPASERAIVWEAALACGVEAVRQRAALDAELRIRGNLLDVLLFDAAGSPSQATLRSSLVGYDLSHPQTLLVLGIDRSSGGEESPLTRRGLVETLLPWLRREHPMSLLAEKDDSVVLLLARPGGGPRRRARRSDAEPAPPTVQLDSVAARLVEELRRQVALVDPQASISVVVASPVPWRELRRAHGVAQRAQVALRLLGERGQTVSTADPRLAIFLLLDGTEVTSLREFVQIVLGPLLSYDDQHGRVLVDTLAAYLAGEGHIETIARTLQIHASTLKYRLRRIGEIGGLDVRNPDHRFNAALALRLRGILPPE
ncbi:MAG TPA: helix-turn-helix domain-containing protein [Chloroflexota bacterium]|nr:helix-turn-helix domain-containing protein [Chloroflexota bacterium]